MMRSLFSGVSGLRTHQLRMDVIGDNIANVNTVGFKRSAVTFKDVFYQTLRGGSASDTAGTGLGGTNPQQIGLGVTLNSIDVVHTQGAAASTGNGTDLMIQGDGFFRVSDGTNTFYTRAGAFHFDNNGYLVTADGLNVLGIDDSPIQIAEMADPTTMPQSFSIDKMGVVHYVDSGGNPTDAGTISIAKFSNPSGLEKVGQNLYRATASSGDPSSDLTPGQGSLAGTSIIPSALEMSNVDLAQEFTDMIITERGFQANARTITVSDQMLQELVNLKR